MSPLPDWLAPLPDAGQQRETDQWAIEQQGIPGRELMERAGHGLAELVAERVPEGRLVVVCGKGNNGGDGLVVARRLRERGREVDVLLLAEPGEYRGDAAANLEALPGSPARPFTADALDGARGIVDAILGTGFTGDPRGPAAEAIGAIVVAGRAGAVVIACDVPSGVDASTGAVQGAAVRAAATATFHAAKPGLWIAPGKDHAGDVTVIEIGIPDGAPVDPAIGLIGPGVLGAVPRRDRASTKFAAGNVMVCGGSLGLTGAPSLAAEAAMRAGAGYVTALVPASLNLVFEVALREVMSVPLPDTDGALQPAAMATVLARLERADALVLGPGLGRAPETQRLARELARSAPVALLLDADGLNAHAGQLETLAARDAPTVLTPHAGELARLLQIDSAAVAATRLGCAREAAARSGAIVVLKGDDTIVAEPEGRVAISPGGAPALATAGTGDVLSGVTGAFLATGLDPFTAACAAVALHLRAGQLAAAAIGAEGVIAGDVIAALPAARAGGVMMALRARARINLAAVQRNVEHLRAGLAGGAELCAVVKANASGHGAIPVARAALAGGATRLAVATAGEAAELREAAIAAPVLIMGALSREELAIALDARAEVVAWSEEFVDAILATAREPVRIHVKYDTGMGRLGTRDRDAALAVADRVLSAGPGVRLAGAMTHFATADGEREFLDEQLAVFAPFVAAMREREPGLTVHAANSAATVREPASHGDMVRCGIALYGADPMNQAPEVHGLQPALELTSYVATVKRIAPGQSAGYGRRYVAGRETWLATVPIGYADGIRRALSGRFDVLIAGRRRPAVGTVSMDNITVDLGPQTPDDVEPETPVTLIGRDGDERITVEELSNAMGSIAHELLCGLSARVTREYHRDGEPA